jgi:effector-binding domain-containing protein
MITPPRIIAATPVPAAIIHLVIPGREMPKYMDPAIVEILQLLGEQGISPAGPLFSYHHRRPSDTFDFDIGFPVAQPIREGGRVVNGSLPGGQVVRSVYQGPYDGLSQAWTELQEWVRKEGLSESGRFYESYITNPDEVNDPAQYRTELNWVVG